MKVICFLIVCAVAAGCGHKSMLDAEDYINYVENPDNGLKQEKKIDRMVYQLQYKPVEYMAAIEQRKSRLNDALLQKRVQEMSDMECYTLRLMAADKRSDVLMAGASSAEQANARNAYMSFDMQNDIYLLEGNDTLSCGLFHYVNNYGLAPYADFVIAFENKKQSVAADRTFVFEDRVFGGGTVNFIIRKTDIENVPTLKTYQ